MELIKRLRIATYTTMIFINNKKNNAYEKTIILIRALA